MLTIAPGEGSDATSQRCSLRKRFASRTRVGAHPERAKIAMVEERMTLTNLSTPDLLARLTTLLGTERRTLASLLAYLIEIEDRRAHLEAACSSLFDFCVRKLGLSEGETFRRITAARLARRFPIILEMIASGRIHLTTLVLLREHLTGDNHVALLGEAAGKTKLQLQELLAARRPRPDVLPSIRKLPERSVSVTRPSVMGKPAPSDHGRRGNMLQKPSMSSGTAMPAAVPAKPMSASVEPLSPGRYKLQLTASGDLKEKLERAARLLSHRPEGSDLAMVVVKAVDELLARLEEERLGKTARPHASPSGKGARVVGAVRREAGEAARPPLQSAKGARVTRAVRRAVFARDGEQCTFRSESGERCPARHHLEIDHVRPRALGGSGDMANLRILCRAHNRLAAERVFGTELIAERILRRQRGLAPSEVGARPSSSDGPPCGRNGGPRSDAPTRRDRRRRPRA